MVSCFTGRDSRATFYSLVTFIFSQFPPFYSLNSVPLRISENLTFSLRENVFNCNGKIKKILEI